MSDREKDAGSRSSRAGGIIFGLTCVCCVAIFFNLLAPYWWVADLMANLRVQQVIAVLVMLAVASAFRRWRSAIVSIALIGSHVPFFATVWPSSHGSAIDVESVKMTRVMVANVLTSNERLGKIVAQVRDSDPEVLAILELGTPLAERTPETARGTSSRRTLLARPATGVN